MERHEYGALPGRADIIHTAQSHYGFKRSSDDPTLGTGSPGPTQSFRDQQEAQHIVQMVRYPGKVKADRVRVKCSNANVKALVTEALTPEELKSIHLC